MKQLVSATIFYFYSFTALAQIYSGQLINLESGLPVPYANIGIEGKNIGTASDDEGRYRIELNSSYDNDTLCISSIGFESRKHLISDFKNKFGNQNQIKIELLPKTYQLDEVIIQPFDTEIYSLGNFCETDSPYGNAFYSKELGTEIGVLINLPDDKKKAFIKNFRFYVGKITFEKFPVRLNVYNLKNGKPFENILTEPIFIELKSAGEYVIDLKKYKIISNGDFFISLEYYRIADSKEGELVFCAVEQEDKVNGYYRLTSQANWIPDIVASVGFSVQLICEE